MALIILQKSTFPDMRDSAPKTWFGRAACTKPLRTQSNLYTAGGGVSHVGGSASFFISRAIYLILRALLEMGCSK